MNSFKRAQKFRCVTHISKRSYFYDWKYSVFRYDRANTLRDVPVHKKAQDGYNTCQIHRWCEGPFQSHYNKDALWWNRTVIRGKRLTESRLWEDGEKDKLMALPNVSEDAKEEICSMFQSESLEKQRYDDFAHRIKLAFQGELEVDDSAPPMPPLNSHEYHALRVKFRYFCRAVPGNTRTVLFDGNKRDTRNALAYISEQYPAVTESDLDALAFCSAVECAKGPSIPFRFGRTDGVQFERKIPDPEAQSAEELRKALPEFSDHQIVALCGLNNVTTAGIMDHKYFDNFPFLDEPFQDIAEKYSVGPLYFQAMLHDALIIMTENGVPAKSWCSEPDYKPLAEDAKFFVM